MHPLRPRATPAGRFRVRRSRASSGSLARAGLSAAGKVLVGFPGSHATDAARVGAPEPMRRRPRSPENGPTPARLGRRGRGVHGRRPVPGFSRWDLAPVASIGWSVRGGRVRRGSGPGGMPWPGSLVTSTASRTPRAAELMARRGARESRVAEHRVGGRNTAVLRPWRLLLGLPEPSAAATHGHRTGIFLHPPLDLSRRGRAAVVERMHPGAEQSGS